MILLNSMQKKKNWRNKEGEYLTVREYNKLAQQARRKGRNVTEYLTELGYKLTYGNKGKLMGCKNNK